jgi:hypothetical protein
VPPDTTITWTAYPSGSIGHYEYQWYSRFHWLHGGYVEPWTALGTAASQPVMIPGVEGSLEVKVVVQSLEESSGTQMVAVDCTGHGPVACIQSGPGDPVDSP